MPTFLLKKYWYPVLVALVICGLLWFLHQSVVTNSEQSQIDHFVFALEKIETELFTIYDDGDLELSALQNLARPTCSTSERNQFDDALRLLDSEVTTAAGHLLLRDFDRCGRYLTNQRLWRGLQLENHLQSYDTLLEVFTVNHPDAVTHWLTRRELWDELLVNLYEYNQLQRKLDDVQLTLIDLRVAGTAVSAAAVQDTVAEIAPLREDITVLREQLDDRYQRLR